MAVLPVDTVEKFGLQVVHVADPEELLYEPTAHATQNRGNSKLTSERRGASVVIPVHVPPSGPEYPASHLHAVTAVLAVTPTVPEFKAHDVQAAEPIVDLYMLALHAAH